MPVVKYDPSILTLPNPPKMVPERAKETQIRLYLGHRLPLGFYGAAGFGRYGSRPTHVVHEDGSVTPVQPMRIGFEIGFVLGVVLAFAWLVWKILPN